LAQSETEVLNNYYPMTCGKILSTVGGRTTALIGIFSSLLGSYESFSYGKSVIKSFYHEDSLQNFESMADFGDGDYRD